MAKLRRELTFPDALLLGLGSIFGTGVFVTLGLAAGLVGPLVLPAILLAGCLATFNALNSAQLAVAHPVSGGAYEYGYRLLGPRWGFSAGILFPLAKSASGATAALALSHIFLPAGTIETRLLALVFVLSTTALVMLGVRRSARVNSWLVGGILAALAVYTLAMFPSFLRGAGWSGEGMESSGSSHFLHATALVFVAYTGYGRLATLGEEVADPARTIPRAIIGTLVVTSVLYFLVALVGVSAVGGAAYGEASRHSFPLAVIAGQAGASWVIPILLLAGVVSLLAVLLNLVLGLSRVALAMGRRGDLPRIFSGIHQATGNPDRATLLVGLLACFLVLINTIESAWTLSAFTVLVYYGINNLAALRLPRRKRLYARWVAWAGLAGCLSLAIAIPPATMIPGLAIIVAALVVRHVLRG